MGEQHGFKTSFRGFSRQDVLTYIDNLRMTMHNEQEELRAECDSLRTQLEEAQAQLADVPRAAEREAALTQELADAQETINALRQQVETLGTQLKEAEAAIHPEREQELTDALAEARAEVQALRDHETELNAQLAETHQAVAALWQEKESAERKVTAALSYADRQQQSALEFKQQLGEENSAPEEKPSGQRMERWLF